MSEVTVTVAPSDNIRAFNIQYNNALTRYREADNFIVAFRKAQERGNVVSEKSVREVESILHTGDERYEVAAFRLAVAAGESADIDHQLEVGVNSLQKLESMSARLHQELAGVRAR